MSVTLPKNHIYLLLFSLLRWLLPPQALNAYYLPNKNQMGEGFLGQYVTVLPSPFCSRTGCSHRDIAPLCVFVRHEFKIQDMRLFSLR